MRQVLSQSEQCWPVGGRHPCRCCRTALPSRLGRGWGPQQVFCGQVWGSCVFVAQGLFPWVAPRGEWWVQEGGREREWSCVQVGLCVFAHHCHTQEPLGICVSLTVGNAWLLAESTGLGAWSYADGNKIWTRYVTLTFLVVTLENMKLI